MHAVELGRTDISPAIQTCRKQTYSIVTCHAYIVHVHTKQCTETARERESVVLGVVWVRNI